MIWVLIVTTMAGSITMQPTATLADCERLQRAAIGHMGRNNTGSVSNSVCVQIHNPYPERR